MDALLSLSPHSFFYSHLYWWWSTEAVSVPRSWVVTLTAYISFALLLISSPVYFMIAVPKSPKSCLSRSFESFSRVSELDPCFLFIVIPTKSQGLIGSSRHIHITYLNFFAVYLWNTVISLELCLIFVVFSCFLSPFIFHSCILWWSCFKYTSMVSDQMWWL